MNFGLRHLYASYRNKRHISLSVDQFTYLINLFPSLMVCMSDGIMDDKEWAGLEKNIEVLSFELSQEEGVLDHFNLQNLFLSELKYLSQHLSEWQEAFISALSDHLKESTEDKDFVLESLYLFANVSGGGISSEESSTIRMLSRRLGLQA